jgi:hypothetical protein
VAQNVSEVVRTQYRFTKVQNKGTDRSGAISKHETDLSGMFLSIRASTGTHGIMIISARSAGEKQGKQDGDTILLGGSMRALSLHFSVAGCGYCNASSRICISFCWLACLVSFVPACQAGIIHLRLMGGGPTIQDQLEAGGN